MKIDRKRTNGFFVCQHKIWEIAVTIRPSLLDDWAYTMSQPAHVQHIRMILRDAWGTVAAAIRLQIGDTEAAWSLPYPIGYDRRCVELILREPIYGEMARNESTDYFELIRIAKRKGIVE